MTTKQYLLLRRKYYNLKGKCQDQSRKLELLENRIKSLEKKFENITDVQATKVKENQETDKRKKEVMQHHLILATWSSMSDINFVLTTLFSIMLTDKPILKMISVVILYIISAIGHYVKIYIATGNFNKLLLIPITIIGCFIPIINFSSDFGITVYFFALLIFITFAPFFMKIND